MSDSYETLTKSQIEGIYELKTQNKKIILTEYTRYHFIRRQIRRDFKIRKTRSELH